MNEIPLAITTAFLIGQLPIYHFIIKKSFGDRIRNFLEDGKKTIETDINDMIKHVKKLKKSEDKAEYFYDKSLDWINVLDIRERYFDLLKDFREKYIIVLFLLFVQVLGNLFPDYIINQSGGGSINMFTVGIFAFILVLIIIGKQTYEWLKINEILTKRELGSSFKEIFKSLEEEEE